MACEPRRRGVRGTRIAEVTPAGPPSVRVDTRIEPTHVAHRLMDDKAALDLTRPSPSQRVEPLLAPRRDLAVARNLGRPEACDELVRIGRLVGAGTVVDVKF